MMTVYQWRSNESCYDRALKKTEKPCKPTPGWFYLLLGVAAVAGLSQRKGKR